MTFLSNPSGIPRVSLSKKWQTLLKSNIKCHWTHNVRSPSVSKARSTRKGNVPQHLTSIVPQLITSVVTEDVASTFPQRHIPLVFEAVRTTFPWHVTSKVPQQKLSQQPSNCDITDLWRCNVTLRASILASLQARVEFTYIHSITGMSNENKCNSKFSYGCE